MKFLLAADVPSALPTPRRSWLPFILLALVLLFVACAAGVLVWYRLPYEERELVRDPEMPVKLRVTVWQRQWGGGRLKHGKERYFVSGHVIRPITFRDGRKDGPYREYLLTGRDLPKGFLVEKSEPSTIGQYADDQKDGFWTGVVNGQKQTKIWDHGKLREHKPDEQ